LEHSQACLVNRLRGWVKVSPYSVVVHHRGGSRWFTGNRGLAFVKIEAPVTPRAPVGFMECSVHRRVPTVGRAVLISQAPCLARVHDGCVGFMTHRKPTVSIVNIVKGFVGSPPWVFTFYWCTTGLLRLLCILFPPEVPRGTGLVTIYNDGYGGCFYTCSWYY